MLQALEPAPRLAVIIRGGRASLAVEFIGEHTFSVVLTHLAADSGAGDLSL